MRPNAREYIPAIDGLRALAIACVLGFHFSPGRFPGGYVGVDVFFVISGFLITRIILDALGDDTFSFRDFYRRRFFRIVPALAATVLLVLVLGVLLFTPSDLERLGSAGIAAVMMLPNLYFWGESGYFDVGAELKPLLHFWSLGVEEQFYWLWPLLLLAAYRWRGLPSCGLLLIAIGSASLVGAELYLDVDSSGAFFLTPFRMVEFVIGAACLWLPWREQSLFGGVPAVAFGLGAIVVASLFFDASTRFPGVTSLVPCIGAAMLIVAARTPAARIAFANPVSRGLGRISYSLYLVHWPILVFAGYWIGEPLDRSDKILLLALSIFVALAMYRYVEKPFRLSRESMGRPANRARTMQHAALIFAALAVGVSAAVSGGMPFRINEDAVAKPAARPDSVCEAVEAVSRFEQICEIRSGVSTPLKALVIGDSHADHFVPALSHLAPRLGLDFVVWMHWGCPPLWNTYKSRIDDPARERSCAAATRSWESHIAENDYDLVILAARWMWLFEPTQYGDLELRRDYLLDRIEPRHNVSASRQLFAERLAATVTSIADRGSRVVIVSQVPLLAKDIHHCDAVPELVYGTERLRRRCDPGVSYDEQMARLAFTNSAIENVASACVLPILPSDYICDAEERSCRAREAGRFLYADRDHLSTDGSIWFAQEISESLSRWIRMTDTVCILDRQQ